MSTMEIIKSVKVKYEKLQAAFEYVKECQEKEMLASPIIKADKVETGINIYALENAVIKLEEARCIYAEYLKSYLDIRQQAKSIIEMLPVEEMMVLYSRYMLFCSWQETAERT